MIVNKTIGFFRCTSQPDGNYYLDTSPGNECYESEWYRHLSLAIFGLIAWVIGVPAIILFILTKYRRSLADSDTMALFGFFFVSYKESYFYWQEVVLARKLLLILAFVISDTIFQVVFFFAVSFAYTILVARLMPYATKTANALEIVTNCCILILLFLGIMFYNESLDKDPLLILCVIVLVLTLVLIVAVVFMEIYWYSNWRRFVFFWKKTNSPSAEVYEFKLEDK